ELAARAHAGYSRAGAGLLGVWGKLHGVARPSELVGRTALVRRGRVYGGSLPGGASAGLPSAARRLHPRRRGSSAVHGVRRAATAARRVGGRRVGCAVGARGVGGAAARRARSVLVRKKQQGSPPLRDQ